MNRYFILLVLLCLSGCCNRNDKSNAITKASKQVKSLNDFAHTSAYPLIKSFIEEKTERQGASYGVDIITLDVGFSSDSTLFMALHERNSHGEYLLKYNETYIVIHGDYNVFKEHLGISHIYPSPALIDSLNRINDEADDENTIDYYESYIVTDSSFRLLSSGFKKLY